MLAALKKSDAFKFISTTLLNYIPGLTILVFGMLALHSSLRVIENNDVLLNHYSEKSQDILYLEEQYNRFEGLLIEYAEAPSPQKLKRAKASFSNFTDLYYSRLHQSTSMVSVGYDRAFHKVLMGFENDLIKTAEVINGLADVENIPTNRMSVLELVHSLHEKIESLWWHMFNQNQMARLDSDAQFRGSMLYWSVIAIGLAGFLLVVLNTDKLKRLHGANEEKQKDLKLLEDRLAAMEAARDGIGIVDEEGNLTYLNKALVRLHGLEPRAGYQFLGQDWNALFNETGKARIDDNVIMNLELEGYWRGERKITQADGDKIATEFVLTSLIDGGFVVTVRDLSDEQRASEEKEELQQQLFQAQKMEAIGQLAGGVAHDFNNILAAMNGYAEFLMEDLEEGSEQRNFAANILQAGRQAKTLVDQMLAFSRANKETEMKAMDLLSPLNECFSMLQASFPKSIELKTDIQLEQAPVMGNATQVSQAIMNLAVNARDSIEGESGGVEIKLSTVDANDYPYEDFIADTVPNPKEGPIVKIVDESASRVKLFLNILQKDQRYAKLSVRDTGSGMSRTVLERVFEPFFTTKSVDKGTGLGLATVHGVVISHGGGMVIDTELGKGTGFEIFLPMTDSVELEEVVGAKKAADRELSGCILLVEDQEEVAGMMLKMLERIGFEPSHVPNGLEALEVLRENPGAFDAVLTDHNMPKMTGFELIKQASMDFPDLPFLVLSGYKEEELDPLIFEHESVFVVMRKPIAREELEKTMNDLFSSQSKGSA